MAHHIEDRWLWLSLGIFTFFAVKGVAYGLRRIVTLTEIHDTTVNTPQQFTLGKQDAIKTTSLQTLATCHNVEIRKAATKILIDRFMKHPTAYKALAEDFDSNGDRHHAAILAFKLFERYGYVTTPFGVPPPTPQTLRVGTRGASSLLAGEWESARDRRHSDPDERDLRRRHREAMIINEGDRPVSQDDVWMRDDEGRMSTEEHVAPGVESSN